MVAKTFQSEVLVIVFVGSIFTREIFSVGTWPRNALLGDQFGCVLANLTLTQDEDPVKYCRFIDLLGTIEG
eukprot:CAMPEP_0196213190 /NCGR_PEP_ID=MMETSP0912-20130531/23862_1 /TAXON_ID=49265 /ORGANISM="Thalassiosira rotula, Strain GSO102" /LENGTH=70 /DNA_ID=CAMNT_0041489389 /DNA_START=101 /DNA_END=309 /DNA_ORIENTATION=+